MSEFQFGHLKTCERGKRKNKDWWIGECGQHELFMYVQVVFFSIFYMHSDWL